MRSLFAETLLPLTILNKIGIFAYCICRSSEVILCIPFNHLIHLTMNNSFDLEREQDRLRAENRRATIQSYVIGMGIILIGFAYAVIMTHLFA